MPITKPVLPLLAAWSIAAIAAAPSSFTYAERSGVATGVFVASDAVSLGGFEGSLPVGVGSGQSAQYRIGNGAFTNAPGSIASGQTLTVRHLSASTANALTTSTVTVGDYNTSFKSTTGSADTTPDAFGFGGIGNVPPSTLVESASIVPTGFNASVLVTAGNGLQYRINAGNWTGSASNLLPGQSLTVRHTSNASKLGYTKTTLTIGGVQGLFTTRTQGAYTQAAYPLAPPPPPPPPTVSVADVTVLEDSGAMEFVVTLSKASDSTVKVNYASANGTATAGQDYFGRGGPLSFAPGETSKTITLTLNQDKVDEPNEALSFTLEAPENATLARATATGTITDDDAAPATALGCPTLPNAAATAPRRAEVVVINGAQIAQWAVPAAQGSAYPYPSGVIFTAPFTPAQIQKLDGRSAHNGEIVYPPPGAPAALMGKPAERIAAYKWDGTKFVEVPVQVDQKFPYFLANSHSDFSVYSGTDEELTYQWDRERWTNDDVSASNPCIAKYAVGMADPVTGLDEDDEIAFMAQDTGGKAPQAMQPVDADRDTAEALQEVTISDPLNPGCPSYVYLGIKKAGKLPAFANREVYVKYRRDADADQWIDRTFFADSDPLKIGTSNTGYGSNLSGKVCPTGLPGSAKNSTDRFPRDGTTVQTDAYRWVASGRWMIRSIEIAKPGQALTPGRAPGAGISYGVDVLDRWKGRAFQQSPDSNISVVGFEDEQVNWEANSILIGDRTGPVRAMREVWGADSGTNVTKTEVFTRDFMTQRYHVRVHPIPSDGLYTSWDYNRSAMVPDPVTEASVPPGKYFTVMKPAGVLIDGKNDDTGQVDSTDPVNGQCPTPDGFTNPAPNGKCPAYFDVADPTLNLPLAFDNWEQVSAKGDNGSLVYSFELKGVTSAVNPVVVPYYRDDACLDDGTGDDPVQRPWPGESYVWNNQTVPKAYNAMAGRTLDYTGGTFNDCLQRQGAHAAHGIHYFFTGDSDNGFVQGKATTEIDGQQWQFAVPSFLPVNVGEAYINVVRAPLKAAVSPR